MPGPLLVTVLGPTASGKTAFAARLAHRLGGEIISADSRQVYRKMDLGTGKDYSEYIIEGQKVPCHLTDIVDAGYKYSVFEYQRDFAKVWEDIRKRGKQAILCGGSGMYIESVTDAYQLVKVPYNKSLRKELESKSVPELTRILSSCRKLHNISDTSSRERLVRAIEIALFTGNKKDIAFSFPAFDNVILGIDIDRDERRKRITDRLEARLQEGLIEEVEQLLKDGIAPEDLIFYGLEYKYITLFITGMISYDEMKSQLNTAIHQFAKRQMTWFRRMEKRGYNIHWLDAGMSAERKIKKALKILEKHI
ncbi:MAG: tRNA (adenosine(37)-N6)-dimethylallyltransferase MiaA [Bacteroidales bacterium]